MDRLGMVLEGLAVMCIVVVLCFISLWLFPPSLQQQLPPPPTIEQRVEQLQAQVEQLEARVEANDAIVNRWLMEGK